MACEHREREVLACQSDGVNCIATLECAACGHRWRRVREDDPKASMNPGLRRLPGLKCHRCPAKHNPFL